MNEKFQNSAADALKYTSFLVIALIVFIAILSVNALKNFGYIGESEETQNTIQVSGEGEAFVVPDVATFSYSVVEQGDTVNEAQEQATQKWNEILTFLEEEDVDEEDVKTIGFNVSPRYAPLPEGGRMPDVAREIVGYEVRQTAEVTVRDTSNVGSVLSGVGGYDVQNLSGLSLTVEDDEEVRSEAREQAIENAQEKAQDLARSLGVRIDDVVGFRESNVSPYNAYRSDMMFAAEESADGAVSTPEIPMGENRVVVNVEVTYRIR